MSLKIIILAGGKGTRISPVIGDTPKILASVAGKPFLEWFLIWIKSWNLDLNFEILISTCIGHSHIKDYCMRQKYNLQCVKEEKPLGTFGAIANVAAMIYSKNYLILNGDTIFKADFNNIYENYKKENKDRPLLILKESLKNERYGGYKNTDKGWIFTNKNTNFISLGAFFISHENLKKRWLEKTSIKFDPKSINKNSLQEMMIDKDCFGKNPISGIKLNHDIPFLDIGIPSSYNESQTYIPKIIKGMKFND